MKRLASYYHPKLPIYLLAKLKELKYDSNAFLDWAVLFPKMPVSIKGVVKGGKDKLIIITTYYFVGFYVLACLVIAYIVPLFGILALLISPLIVIGYIYCLAYTLGIRSKSWREHWQELSGMELKPKDSKENTGKSDGQNKKNK